MQKLGIILFFNLLYCTNCKAQINTNFEFRFKNYTTHNGIADNVVVKTLKDKNGFLWIATHNGLSRFDGLKFKNYSHNPTDSNSLRSIWISDLLIDKEQTLWITTEWGLCYYNDTKDNFVYINNKANMQLVYKMPLCNYDKNTIYIAAEDGLKKINTHTKKYDNTTLNRIVDPQFIVKDNSGNLIIGTRGRGLYKYNIAGDNYKLLLPKKLPFSTHYMGACVYENNIWIASEEGLMLLNNDESTMLFSNADKSLKNNSIKQLMCVSPFVSGVGKDFLVCGTYDKKLLLFDIKKKKFVQKWTSNESNPEGFLTSIVYDIYENNKTLWIGTDRGLKQLNTDNQQQQSFYISPLLAKEDLPLVKKVIANSEVDNKKIWLIPQKPYAGLVLYNLKNQKIIKEWNTTKTTKGKIYSDIIHSKNESIIIASRDSGLDFFTEKKGLIKTIKLTEKINCIVEDTFGNLWLGTDDGLIFFNNKTNISTKFQSTFTGSDVEKNAFGGEFPISDLKIGVDNKIWLTNSKYGLFSFDIITKKFTSHRQNANSKFSTLDRCSSVTIVSKDSIWFGNMAGLSCYVPSQNKFINFDVTKGLKSTYIYSIIKDAANNIWARGNADVFYFNTNSKKIISTILNPSCNIFSYKQKLNISGNSIFLGHEAGFTIFDANNFVKPITAKPLLKIISYKSNIGNVFVPNENNFAPIKLNYNDNQIGFEYAAIEYNNPEEIEYWHRLEGLEKEFISSADNRVVDYTNLPHGKYRFTVYAINKHTNIKSELAFLNFTIQPAFWQRWWFWPVLALFFVMLVVSFAQKRITTIRQKEKQKTAVNKAMAELETKMFRSQMNPHFIFNSLNSIQKYIWENKEEDAAEYLAQFAKLIRAILENSRKETVLLKEEIEVMKLYIDLEHRRSNANFDYSIKVNEDIDLQNVAIPPLLLQPFIENAIWHGLSKKQKKGNLNINITKNNNQLICVIDDDGVGRQDFNNNTEKKSVGIEITKQRIDKLMEMTKQYANVTIFDKNENGEPLGTKVIITLPLQICES